MLVYGLLSGSPRFFCVHCNATHEGKFANYDPNRDDLIERKDLNEINESESKVRHALFKTIPHTNYICPFLHVWLTVGVDIINVIRKAAINVDLKSIQGNKYTRQGCEYYRNITVT
jgi:hypothetical protein